MKFFRRFTFVFLLSLSLIEIASAQDSALPERGFSGFVTAAQLTDTYTDWPANDVRMFSTLGLGYDVNQYVGLQVAYILNREDSFVGPTESGTLSLRGYSYGITGKLPINNSFRLVASYDPVTFSGCSNFYNSTTRATVYSYCASASTALVTVGADIALDRRSSLRMGYMKSGKFFFGKYEQQLSGPVLAFLVRF